LIHQFINLIIYSDKFILRCFIPHFQKQPNKIKSHFKYKTDGGVRLCPAIGKDGTIYFISFDCHLYAINMDGTLKCKYFTEDIKKTHSSPSISIDGTIYFGAGYSNFYAINSNGSLKWRISV